jgi:hypothetical protein
MDVWEAFLLGVMVAYSPSLVVAALLLRRADEIDGSSAEPH